MMASNLSTTFGNVVVSALVATGVTLTGNLALGGNDITGVDALTITGDATLGDASTDNVSITGDVNMVGSGSIIATTGSQAVLTLVGSGDGTGTGATFCVQDTDAAGYTVVNALNGTLTARTAQADECAN